MRKINICCSVLIFLMIIVVGCQQPLQLQEKANDGNTIGIQVKLPGGISKAVYGPDDAALYKIEMTLNDVAVQSKSGAPGDTIVITVDKEGKYSVTVFAYDIDSTEIAKGSVTADLKFGKGIIPLQIRIKGYQKTIEIQPDIIWETDESEYTYYGRTFSMPKINLPESVGQNPFAGRVFTTSDGNGNNTSLSTWSFTNNKATYSNSDSSYTMTYNYTYNTNNNLLYLACTELSQRNPSGDGVETLNSVSSVVEFLEGYYPDYSEERKCDLIDWGLKCYFYSKEIYQYSISENTLNLIKYFDGTLPVEVRFVSNNNTSPYISLCGSCLSLGSQPGCPCCYFCDFNDGKIFGKLVTSQYSGPLTVLEGEILGDFEASYTTSGTGPSNCSVTLTFTKLPESIQGYEIGMPYVISQYVNSQVPAQTAITGVYRGTLIGTGLTVYTRMTVNNDFTWTAQGYTDSTFTTTTDVGTVASGTYSRSGDSYVFTAYSGVSGVEMFVVNGIPSGDCTAITFSGTYEGICTRE